MLLCLQIDKKEWPVNFYSLSFEKVHAGKLYGDDFNHLKFIGFIMKASIKNRKRRHEKQR